MNSNAQTSSSAIYNKSTRVIVLIMGILTGAGGMFHGIAEVLQGNKPAVDILTRIGAFSIIPNYFITGLTAIIISFIIICWSVCFIHKRNGPAIYLLLSIALFLAGGGFAHIPGFLITWSIATRINKPLTWWRKIFPGNIKKFFSKIWLPALITGFAFLFTGISLWLLLTPPGTIYKVGITHYIIWSSLLLALLFIILTIIFGFARDIELMESLQQKGEKVK